MPTHFVGTNEEVLALNTFIKLSRAHDAFTRRLMARRATDDLTESQFGVLEALLHLGPMMQGALSQKLLTSSGNMTLVLDNLEKRNLVRRVRSVEDRRIVMIELTPAGEDLIRKIMPRQVQAITEEMSVLTPEEQAQLGSLCRKLGLGKTATKTCDSESAPLSGITPAVTPN